MEQRCFVRFGCSFQSIWRLENLSYISLHRWLSRTSSVSSFASAVWRVAALHRCVEVTEAASLQLAAAPTTEQPGIAKLAQLCRLVFVPSLRYVSTSRCNVRHMDWCCSEVKVCLCPWQAALRQAHMPAPFFIWRHRQVLVVCISIRLSHWFVDSFA